MEPGQGAEEDSRPFHVRDALQLVRFFMLSLIIIGSSSSIAVPAQGMLSPLSLPSPSSLALPWPSPLAPFQPPWTPVSYTHLTLPTTPYV